MTDTTYREPTVIDRAEQPYVFVGGAVTMETIDEIADRLHEVFGWLAARGVAPAGAPFLRYKVIAMRSRLDIEAGVPVAAPVDGDARVRAGVLPAGRYVTVTHVGHPERLISVTGALLCWSREQGLRFDSAETPAGERWGCRLEIYKTDPRAEPDPARWATDLAFRLAD